MIIIQSSKRMVNIPSLDRGLIISAETKLYGESNTQVLGH